MKRLLNSCSLMPYRCLLFASGFKDIVPSTETHSARPALMRQLEPIQSSGFTRTHGKISSVSSGPLCAMRSQFRKPTPMGPLGIAGLT